MEAESGQHIHRSNASSRVVEGHQHRAIMNYYLLRPARIPFSVTSRRSNRYASPDQVHECGRVGSIKNRVCGQQNAAADIEELEGSRVSFQFLGGNQCVSD